MIWSCADTSHIIASPQSDEERWCHFPRFKLLAAAGASTGQHDDQKSCGGGDSQQRSRQITSIQRIQRTITIQGL